MTARLLTAVEAVERFGLPCERTLRTMRNKGLRAVRLGKAYLFDASDIEAFIEASKESPCPAPIEAHASDGLPVAKPITSSGMSAAFNGCDPHLQQTLARLKTLSRDSSRRTGDRVGRVIQAKFG